MLEIKPGDELGNGAILIAAKEFGKESDNWVVLALTLSPVHAYATWIMNKKRICFSGEYHTTIESAVIDFGERARQ